jgi:hypothetical protein
MKKKIFFFLVLSFAVGLTFVTCIEKPKSLSSSLAGSVSGSASGNSLAIPNCSSCNSLAGLALAAAMANPNSTIQEIRDLYYATQTANCTAMSFTALESDVCTCPNDPNRLCPCPSDTAQVESVAYFAMTDTEPSVTIDNQPLRTFKLANAQEWTAFQWPANLPNGNHTVTVSGNFLGSGKRKYTLKIAVKEGKAAVPWK